MTVDVRPKEVGETLRELSKRLYRAEQQFSRPTGAPAGFGSNPEVDTITVDGIVVGSAASPATNLTLSTGAHMENIWIDADWDAPADGTAGSYDVELARKVGTTYELVQNFHITGGTSLRMAGLEPGRIYGVRVIAINRIGVRATPLPSPGWQDIETAIDATIPAQVGGLSVTGTFRGFIVTWNEVADRDVAKGTGTYQLQWSSADAPDFDANIVGDEYTTATMITVSVSGTNTAFFFFRVRAVDNSGNAGAWSTIVSAQMTRAITNDLQDTAVTTAKLANLSVNTAKLANLSVDAAKLADSSVESTKIANLAVGSAAIAALAVGTAHIANAAITTAKIGDLQVTNGKIENLAVDDAKIANLDAVKITAGTINADRIAANSLDVNKLTTSTLTSKTITLGAGGTLKIGNAPTTGILINDQGIRLYSGSSVKVALDVAGTATFEGNISASTITSSTLTSATINSGTITGTTVRTASSGKRISMEAGVIDQFRFYSGGASETGPGLLGVDLGFGLYRLDLRAPKTGHDYGVVIAASDASASNSAGAALEVHRSNGTIKASLNLFGMGTSGTPRAEVNGISEMQFSFVGGTTNAAAKLRGSGDYGFLYLFGGGTASTLNVNLGLSAGLHVMDSNNSGFHPIQASAFNVSSAASTKKNIRDEGLTSDRLRRLRVVRFNRVHTDLPEDPPPHLRRFYDLEEVGFLADQVMEVMPEAVVTDKDGVPIGVNLAVIVGVLVKTVQELLPGRP